MIFRFYWSRLNPDPVSFRFPPHPHIMAEETLADLDSYIEKTLQQVVARLFVPKKDFTIKKRIGTGTFHVYRASYTGESTAVDIIGKEIPCKLLDDQSGEAQSGTLQFSKDRLNYAIDEANLNKRCRQYGWMPISHYMGWSYDDSSETFWLFFHDDNGRPFTQELIKEIGTPDLKIHWTKTLMFALCCSHVTGVFHQDVSDFTTSGTINAILIDKNELKLIDFGDGIEAKTDEKAQQGLLEDIKGFLNFVLDHLYKGLIFEKEINDKQLIKCVEELRRINEARKVNYNKQECKALFCKMLNSMHYTFPNDFTAVLRVEDMFDLCLLDTYNN